MNIAGACALVTGGAGLVGSHLADALLDRGLQVRILDNFDRYTHPRGAPGWLPRKAQTIAGSVVDARTLRRALEGVDLVFHQAAFTGFDRRAARSVRTNAVGVAELFDVITAHRLPVRKIVVASSLSVYGEGKHACAAHGVQYPSARPLTQLTRRQWDLACPVCGEPMRWLATDEASDRGPFTPYSVSKYAGELLARGLGAQFGIPTVVLRYAVVYGPRQSIFNPYSTVVTTFTTLLKQGKPPVIYEDGEQRRDWIHVEDVVRANLLAMEDDRASDGIFNVGTGRPTSVRELAELLAQRLAPSIQPLQRGEFRLGDIRHLVLDVSRVRALGFEPRITLPDGIGQFLEWFQSLGDVSERYSRLEARMRTAGELVRA